MIILFVPSSLSKLLIKDLKSLAKEVIVCTKKPQHLFKSSGDRAIKLYKNSFPSN